MAGALDVEDVADLEAILRLRSFKVELTPRDIARLFAAAVRIVGPAILKKPPVPSIEAPRHRRGLHSLARDKAAIRHHYDVSNAFYELILGPTMVYSCAYFAEPGESLEAAQTRKLDLICRKLRLAPGERLLDIGCGWGSLLIHAAQRYGVQRRRRDALARAGRARARARRARSGLSDRIEIRVHDYRELDRRAVRQDRQRRHVRARRPRRARPLHGPGARPAGAGRAVPQPRDRAPALRGPSENTFIYRYVFPDGELSPVTDVMAVAAGRRASRCATSSRCASTTR